MFSESRHECIDIRAAAPASEPLQKLMSDTSRPLILIVDDDGDLRELLATIFQNDGYCVSRAGDGLEAIEKALRLSPSLIVMDLSLPRLDGCSAIRLLKGDPETHHIPIVAVSGYGVDDERSRRARDAGCDAFFEKPLPFSAFLVCVRQLAGSRSLATSCR